MKGFSTERAGLIHSLEVHWVTWTWRQGDEPRDRSATRLRKEAQTEVTQAAALEICLRFRWGWLADSSKAIPGGQGLQELLEEGRLQEVVEGLTREELGCLAGRAGSCDG